MPNTLTNATATQFDAGVLLDLIQIDTRPASANGQVFYFHGGVNGLLLPVVYNGISYTPFPVELVEFSTDGKGNPTRVKLRLSNINGFVSQYLRTEGDLINSRVSRIRVFGRFLDAVNFPNGVNVWGTPDPTAAYEPDIFYLSRKVSESAQYVEFECTSPLEIDNTKLPRRQILATVCPFQYRDPSTCGYNGPPVSDRNGKVFGPGGYGFNTLSDAGAWNANTNYSTGQYVSVTSTNDFTYGNIFVYVCSVPNTSGNSTCPTFSTTNWYVDACQHNLLGCKMHFPTGALPGAFYPGVARYPYN